MFSFVGDADKLLHIQIEDSVEANISPFLRHICHFIGKGDSLTRQQLSCAQGPEGLWHLDHTPVADFDFQSSGEKHVPSCLSGALSNTGSHASTLGAVGPNKSSGL